MREQEVDNEKWREIEIINVIINMINNDVKVRSQNVKVEKSHIRVKMRENKKACFGNSNIPVGFFLINLLRFFGLIEKSVQTDKLQMIVSPND